MRDKKKKKIILKKKKKTFFESCIVVVADCELSVKAYLDHGDELTMSKVASNETHDFGCCSGVITYGVEYVTWWSTHGKI